MSTPTADHTDLLSTWRARTAPFTAEVQAVTDWSTDSPCEGWTARDVLAHVVDTEREFLARAGLVIEGSADAAASSASDGPASRWDAHATEVDALLADRQIAERPHEGAFGPTTIGAVMVEFYGFDLLVHRWDLARSQGREVRFTEQELELMNAAVDGWGEHAYAPGVFSRALDAPVGADAQSRVLARTGRRG